MSYNPTSCPHKVSRILTNIVTGCHPLALKVTDGSICFGEPDPRNIAIPRNFLGGKTDNRDRRLGALATNSPGEDTIGQHRSRSIPGSI